MGQIRTAIRAYAVEGHPPDVVVSHANRLMVGMGTDLFATCCYVELDMEEGETWIVRAATSPRCCATRTARRRRSPPRAASPGRPGGRGTTPSPPSASPPARPRAAHGRIRGVPASA
ncbi:serine/threonine-protein phosphatase [Streptomyces somaliensis]|nr:serine/threonine-protein phosphatase [Streptomyces somaliensis]